VNIFINRLKLCSISKCEKNFGVVNGLKPVVRGKSGECNEVVDEIVRIKNSLVDVIIL
jgi:hypothetical protein